MSITRLLKIYSLKIPSALMFLRELPDELNEVKSHLCVLHNSCRLFCEYRNQATMLTECWPMFLKPPVIMAVPAEWGIFDGRVWGFHTLFTHLWICHACIICHRQIYGMKMSCLFLMLHSCMHISNLECTQGFVLIIHIFAKIKLLCMHVPVCVVCVCGRAC